MTLKTNLIVLGDMILDPEDVSHILPFTYEPPEVLDVPDSLKKITEALIANGKEGHHSQITFKNATVVYTSHTIESIWEALNA